MKIAIINSSAGFMDFFVNLAKYLELNGNTIVFLSPDKFLKRIIVKYDLKYENYSELTLNYNYYNKNSDFIKFNSRLYKIKNTQSVVKQKNRKYDKAFNYLKNNNFDYILIFNGALDVETDVCKELNLKTLFFEQGYLPHTIQADAKGVNCNTSFSDLELSDIMQFTYRKNNFEPETDFNIIKVNKSIFLRYFFRFFDYNILKFAVSFLGRKYRLAKAKKRFAKLETEFPDTTKFGKYIFFPLQVNTDTQILLNSKYSSMYEAIKSVLPYLLNTGLNIVLKEHPFEVEPVDYSEFIDNKRIFLTKKTDIDLLIENSEFVVNINSSVGFQSVAKYKKVVLLGKSFYGKSPLSLEFEKINKDNLITELDKILVDKNLTDSYIEKFKNDIFIPGHFYSVTIEMLEMIRNRLT